MEVIRGLTAVWAKLLMMLGSLEFRAAMIALMSTLSNVLPSIFISIFSVCTKIESIWMSKPTPPLQLGALNDRAVSVSSFVMFINRVPFCLGAIPILNSMLALSFKVMFLEFMEKECSSVMLTTLAFQLISGFSLNLRCVRLNLICTPSTVSS